MRLTVLLNQTHSTSLKIFFPLCGGTGNNTSDSLSSYSQFDFQSCSSAHEVPKNHSWSSCIASYSFTTHICEQEAFESMT